jgi:hypothetical protein
MVTKLSQNLKAVEALIGSGLMVGNLLLAVAGFLPASWAGGIAAGLAALTTFRVWLAKNEPLILGSVEAVDELVDGTVGAFQKRGA